MTSIERIPVAAALARLRAGFASAPVAGRLVREGAGWALADASGRAALAAPSGAAEGDIVSGRLATGADGSCRLDGLTVLTRRLGPPPEADQALPARLPLLDGRARVVRAIRSFFVDRGFLEAETPARVVCPGLEPHLVALPAGTGSWLVTSPELHLKRMLAAGVERVFELARVWRGDERGAWHATEFTMLEWYRAYDGLDAIAADIAALLPAAARAGGADPRDVRGCDLTREPERITVREAFRRETGLDLAALRDRGALADAACRLGLAPAPDDGWDEIFFRIFIDQVEPRLGLARPTILDEYPASQAALARVRPDAAWPVALRFEVYVAGIEVANAFDELTDAAEQRRRHEADRANRRTHGREVPDLDEDFLAAIASGVPPSAGIALGVDRLAALVLGAATVAEVIAFP